MTRLVFSDRGLEHLRAALLASAPDEAGAVVLADRVSAQTLLVQHVALVPPDQSTVQEPDRLEIDPRFLAPLLKRARDADQCLILVHTHPFTSSPEFSIVDDAGEARIMPSLFARAPNGPHGALVLGEHGFAGRLHYADGQIIGLDQISEVGAFVLRHDRTENSGEIDDLYDRNVRAFGADGQRRLKQFKIAVVGLGGTGSVVTEQLAHLGVGELLLVDDDKLEITNLNRVVGAKLEQVGDHKVLVAADHVRRIAGERTRTTAISGSVLDESIGSYLLDCDFVFACTDTHGSRAIINQLAYQYLIPAIDMGVRIDAADGVVTGAAGRVQMLAPGLACLQCEELLDPLQVRRDLQNEEERRADPYIVGAREPQPSVITLNSVVASLATTMFLSACIGFPGQSRHQNYLIASGSVRSVASAPTPHCIVCSEGSGALAKGSSWPMFWRRR